jgi:hypothetical protein
METTKIELKEKKMFMHLQSTVTLLVVTASPEALRALHMYVPESSAYA